MKAKRSRTTKALPVKRPVLNDTARKVLGFFVAKGLLIAPDIKAAGSVKLSVEDILWVAENVEPRVLSVLPAAVIHFPATFLDLEALPKKLKDIIEAIKEGKARGPSLPGFPYAEFRRWAYFTLKDKRCRPLGEKKVRKTYRFKPDVVEALEEAARNERTTETAIIERLVVSRFYRR